MLNRHHQPLLAGALAVVGGIASQWLVDASPRVMWMLSWLPWLLLPVAWLDSRVYRLNKNSLMVLICLLSYGVIQLRLQAPLSNPDIELQYWVLGIVTPLLLFLADLWPESERFRFSHGAALLAVIVGGLEWGVIVHGEPLHLWLNQWITVIGGYPQPWVLTLWTALLLGLSMLLHYRRRQGGDSLILPSLVAVLFSLACFDVPAMSATIYTALGGVCLFLLAQHSYNLAFCDQLTQVRNRRSLEASLQRMGQRGIVAMMDIDHFKAFNDRFGHDVGDDVLRLVAQQLETVGHGGKVFRYGGEEFTIIFRSLNRHACIEALEEVRQSIAQYPFMIRGQEEGSPQRITLSIGMAQWRQGAETSEQVIKRADEALYQAKQSGRNCIRVDQPPKRPQRRRAA